MRVVVDHLAGVERASSQLNWSLRFPFKGVWCAARSRIAPLVHVRCTRMGNAARWVLLRTAKATNVSVRNASHLRQGLATVLMVGRRRRQSLLTVLVLRLVRVTWGQRLCRSLSDSSAL